MTRPIRLLAAGAMALLLTTGSCDPLCGCERPQEGHVQGTVVDEQGTPIADAALELRGVSYTGVQTTTTRADGAYEFLDVPGQSNVSLRLQVPAGYALVPGGTNPAAFFVGMSQTVVVDFVLRPAP
ncbi:MAG TPA: carboxypeptidase-like regulatory domain-containing protein [Longimicrobium sp.]|nr:carboxypeptidase-like regulatory domain-containing protein [Longimicrobium sp.]